ncbi:MAG: hypothetical protein R2823_03425 [Acidimicrobiia bacterium]
MRTIEDRLTEASREARAAVETTEPRPVATVRAQRRRQRLLAGATATAMVFGAFAATALIIGTEVDAGLAPGAGGVAPPTTLGTEASDVTGATTTTVPPTEPLTSIPNAPQLALGLTDWTVVMVAGDGSGDGSWSLVYSEGVSAAAWNEGENGQGEEGPRVVIEVISDQPGSEPGEFFDQAVASYSDNEDLGIVMTGTRAEALAYATTDLNTGTAGFTFVWRSSATSVAVVTAFVDSFEEATRIVGAITEVSDWEWNEIFYGYEDAVAGTGEQYPTTTTMVEDGS